MQKVLVTGIGGNVAQGILRIIRSEFPDIKLYGADVNKITAGHYYVDEFIQVPYAYDAAYQTLIEDFVAKENLDLIIPGTDYEAFYLQSFKLNCKVIASNKDAQGMFLDKFLTYENFAKNNIPFAKAFACADYKNELESIIVKPRKGRGSRGLHINPEKPNDFDDSYMVQEYIEGKEITSAFYVSKNKKLIGPITFERELTNGMTSQCETNTKFDKQMLAIAKAMNDNFDLAGPFNIQARVNSEGKVLPFEINCRYSGTNSIRAQLGFNDVAMGIKEYLFDEEPQMPEIKSGSANRIYLDIVYENQSLSEIQAGDKGAKIF